MDIKEQQVLYVLEALLSKVKEDPQGMKEVVLELIESSKTTFVNVPSFAHGDCAHGYYLLGLDCIEHQGDAFQRQVVKYLREFMNAYNLKSKLEKGGVTQLLKDAREQLEELPEGELNALLRKFLKGDSQSVDMGNLDMKSLVLKWKLD